MDVYSFSCFFPALSLHFITIFFVFLLRKSKQPRIEWVREQEDDEEENLINRSLYCNYNENKKEKQNNNSSFASSLINF